MNPDFDHLLNPDPVKEKWNNKRRYSRKSVKLGEQRK